MAHDILIRRKNQKERKKEKKPQGRETMEKQKLTTVDYKQLKRKQWFRSSLFFILYSVNKLGSEQPKCR